ncbi:MAG TPA: DUF3987 domain-containing protein [Nitrososphaeraceae archaeon]|nr:DUF3987 domain-containing protein [Nitrososphaeraceae archaeon]
MTNLERWHKYMAKMKCPEHYITMGFYYMIAAALQRRVWAGPKELPCFPNIYVVLVGEPATGKGQVISQVNEMLKYHKLKPDKDDPNANMAAAFVSPEQIGMKEKKELLLFPMAPDSVTYEALMQTHARSTRLISYKDINPLTGAMEMRPYTHNSLAFALEEMSSLFNRKSEDISRYLLNAYDCRDYTYKTKHQGEDEIRRPCLNLLAGTVPSFIEDSYDKRIMTEGLSSRTFFIYATGPRFYQFGVPAFTEEQIKCKMEVLDHLKKLSSLFGNVIYDPEGYELMRKHIEEILPYKRENTSLKLNPYYGRKDMHLLKMSMIIHFSDSLEMMVSRIACETALALLAEVEKNMHWALSFGGRNPLAGISKEMMKYIKSKGGSVKQNELWEEFIGDVNQVEFNEVLVFLRDTGKIEHEEGIWKMTNSESLKT